MDVLFHSWDAQTSPPWHIVTVGRGHPLHHIAIDRAHGLIRKWTATHAAAHDDARLEDVLDRDNTASEVWADTAYRSVKNEAMLLRRGSSHAFTERSRPATTSSQKTTSQH